MELQVFGNQVENMTRDECLWFLKKMIQMVSVFKAYADMEYDFLFNIQSQDTMDTIVYVISSREYAGNQPAPEP